MQQSRRWHSSELTCLNPFPSGADTGHRVRLMPPDLSTPPKEGNLPREGEFDFLAEAETAFAPTTEECSQQKAQGEDSDADQSGFQPARRRPQRRRKLQANQQREPDKRLPLFS
jgi:hypothetical protein